MYKTRGQVQGFKLSTGCSWEGGAPRLLSINFISQKIKDMYKNM